jgi:GNAT superfamily N-acetyltransferase
MTQPKVSLKAQAIHRIYLGTKPAGHIISSIEKHRSVKVVRSLFCDPLPELDELTASFNYVWIDEVFVLPGYRGSSVARQAIQNLVATSRPCVLALGIGELDPSVPYRDLVTIYKRLGFRVLSEGSDLYGIAVFA